MSNPVTPPETGCSAEVLELLERLRRERQAESVPALARQRLLASAMAEARGGRQSFVVPTGQLVPVRRRAVGSRVYLLGAAALGLVLLLAARRLYWGSPESGGIAAEPRPTAAAERARALGERLLELPLFRAPARALPGAALPASGPNLLGEQPFSVASRAWQVRRWDDLAAHPVEPAAHAFSDGALCVALGPGERVLGGWPWSAPGSSGGASSASAAPAAVALGAGKSYRLAFRAWAREPLPAQLLVAVGHARLPFSGRGGARVPVSTAPRAFVIDFVSPVDDPSVGVAFLATAAQGEGSTRVCLGDMTLTEHGGF